MLQPRAAYKPVRSLPNQAGHLLHENQIKYKVDIVIPFSSQIPAKLDFKKVQTGLPIVKINTNANLGFLNIVFISC